jgi:hypothetical protein
VAGAGDERFELVAQVGDPGRRERAQGRTVVGDLAGDEFVLLAFAVGAVEVAGEL